MKVRLLDQSWLMSNQLSGDAELARNVYNIAQAYQIQCEGKFPNVFLLSIILNPTAAIWQQQGIYVKLKIIRFILKCQLETPSRKQRIEGKQTRTQLSEHKDASIILDNI